MPVTSGSYACCARGAWETVQHGSSNSCGRTIQRSGCTVWHATRMGVWPSVSALVWGYCPSPFQSLEPSCKWLLSVYSQDILTRLDDIKANITSTYGTVLKLDSTKKV